GVIVLAVRNLRRGRGDVHGAVRLGLASLAILAGGRRVGRPPTPPPEPPPRLGAVPVGGGGPLFLGPSYLPVGAVVRRRRARAAADHCGGAAAGRWAGRSDGRAGPADRPGLRVRGAARPAGGLVDRGVGRRPAAAPHGDRAVRPPGFRAADAAVHPALLPDR